MNNKQLIDKKNIQQECRGKFIEIEHIKNKLDWTQATMFEKAIGLKFEDKEKQKNIEKYKKTFQRKNWEKEIATEKTLETLKELLNLIYQTEAYTGKEPNYPDLSLEETREIKEKKISTEEVKSNYKKDYTQNYEKISMQQIQKDCHNIIKQLETIRKELNWTLSTMLKEAFILNKEKDILIKKYRKQFERKAWKKCTATKKTLISLKKLLDLVETTNDYYNSPCNTTGVKKSDVDRLRRIEFPANCY
jgi:hypothetical protein